MDKREHKSKLFARRRPIVAAFSIVYRFLCVLLIAGLAPSLATSSDLQRPSVPAVAPGLPFAIADFDGDLHPDLASVQLGSSDPTHSVYWIRLQLTAFVRQSIRVVGPT